MDATALARLAGWCDEGATVGVATVVATWSSAPQPVGAAMLLGPDGSVVGSLTGGCIEGDVLARLELVQAGAPPERVRYGVADGDAVAVGLACGGTVDVLVDAVSARGWPGVAEVARRVAAGEPVAVVTVVAHPDATRLGRRLVVPALRQAEGAQGVAAEPRSSSRSTGLGSERLDAAVTDDARGLLASGRDEVVTYGPDGERRGLVCEVLVRSHAPAPRLLVFGAGEVAAALARVGGLLGFRVTVCDARAVFATAARFPDADEVVVDWPHRYLAAEAAAGRLDGRSALCVLTHDPKFDVPLLELALRLPVGYVGAMGSRRTHEQRAERLRAAGLDAAALGRLASPIGLDLGARTAGETAVAIAAEIVGRRWGGGGRPLSQTTGRLHHERPDDGPR